MYLIIFQYDVSIPGNHSSTTYISSYSNDLTSVKKCLADGARVFKLDKLTEIKDVEITYQETEGSNA